MRQWVEPGLCGTRSRRSGESPDRRCGNGFPQIRFESLPMSWHCRSSEPRRPVAASTRNCEKTRNLRGRLLHPIHNRCRLSRPSTDNARHPSSLSRGLYLQFRPQMSGVAMRLLNPLKTVIVGLQPAEHIVCCLLAMNFADQDWTV
jgi:hypothetical protein